MSRAVLCCVVCSFCLAFFGMVPDTSLLQPEIIDTPACGPLSASTGDRLVGKSKQTRG